LYPERRTATLAMRLRFPMPDLDICEVLQFL
jgi:hypothetical protein